MQLTLYIPPYAEPVTLTEMKVHLRVESSVTDEDALISALIAASRNVAEVGTGSNSMRSVTMVASTFDLTLRDFPGCDFIEVPKVPLVSVTSITYVDVNGTTQTLATTVYSVNVSEGRIYLAYGQTWPALRGSIEDRITVRFVAGMAANFATTHGSDLGTVTGRTLTNGDRVHVMNSGGGLPAGWSALTTYYVVGVSGSTFQLSLTSGGSAVAITTDGTGTHFIGPDLNGFDALRAAMKLLVGHWFEHRETVVTGTITAQLPMAVESLIAANHA